MLKVSCLGVFFPCASFLLSGQARKAQQLKNLIRTCAISWFKSSNCVFISFCCHSTLEGNHNKCVGRMCLCYESIISQLDAQLLCHLIFKLYQEGIFTYLCFLLEEIPCSLANIMCFITELFLNNMRSNCLI